MSRSYHLCVSAGDAPANVFVAQLCGLFASCDLEIGVGPSTALFPGGLSAVQATFLSAEC
jgi:hypothetical protein